MGAGAFSNEKVAAAAANLVPIYVDCTSKEMNTELQSQYDVKGYPTVLYVDPTGKAIKPIASRDAGPMVGEMNGIAKKFPGRPTFWHNSIKGAGATKKKVAVYIAKEGADPVKTTLLLTKNLGDRKTKLAWTWETGTAQVLEARGVESAPAVVLYDSGASGSELKLLGKVTVKEGDDPKLMNQGIDEILKSAKD